MSQDTERLTKDKLRLPHANCRSIKVVLERALKIISLFLPFCLSASQIEPPRLLSDTPGITLGLPNWHLCSGAQEYRF